MSSFPQDEQERLVELLGMVTELFGNIREQTKKQTELLESDNIDGFNLSLEARQETIEKIEGLHQEFNSLMQSYVSFSNSADGGKIDAVDHANGLLDAIVRECVELNDKNAETAKEKTEEYIKQIGEMSIRRKSLGKYAHTVPNNPELFDKKT